ncbi:MAG: carotenoid biosynthesis protein [Chlorobi bacterium]|nr:carotenoid biosynthesis protein [Chlorobiota bacterium]MCI0716497.1 carotenoid biosynthesis protein [Chlorobiota bacterium]
MQAGHEANNSVSNSLKILTGLLIVMFPVGLFLMISDWGKQFLWTSSLFLALQAVITFIYLSRLAEIKSVITVTVLILIISFIIELLGLNTGFPFGHYSYTNVLKPFIGDVPIAISFAWFVVSVNSVLISKYFLKGNFTIAVISSVFILAGDILLEPFASFVNNYWVWAEGSIPIQNFLSWLIIGFIFSVLINKTLKWRDDFKNERKMLMLPFLITGINVSTYSIINLIYGYYEITIAGLLIFAILLLSLIKLKPK